MDIKAYLFKLIKITIKKVNSAIILSVLLIVSAVVIEFFSFELTEYVFQTLNHSWRFAGYIFQMKYLQSLEFLSLICLLSIVILLVKRY